jgi:hypothetical protein
MESVTVTLRKKRGRKWEYRDIEVPADAMMERVALELHARGVPAIREVLGWRVVYMPAFPIRYSVQKVDFNGTKVGDEERHETTSVSYCTFGHDQEWSLTLSWANGDDQPPVKCNGRGDTIPFQPVPVQEPLFSESVLRDELIEGAMSRVEQNRYERNREARNQCIGHYGVSCFVCGFSFSEVYGEFVEGFIHVHHVRPISTIGGSYRVDPVSDLRPVCPNCHAAIHACEPAMTPEKLQALVQERRR